MATTFFIGFCFATAVHSIAYFINHINVSNKQHINNIIVGEPETGIDPTLIQKTIESPVYYSSHTIRETSQENIDLVISGLVKIGVKKARAKKIVEMCNTKYYEDAQDLFEACFPHINS